MTRRWVWLVLAALGAACHAAAPPLVESRPARAQVAVPHDAATADAAAGGWPPDASEAAPLAATDAAPPVASDAGPDADCTRRVVGQSYGRASCHADNECHVVTSQCCPPCGPMRPGTERAVRLGESGPACRYGCPACAAWPTGGVRAACVSGRCQIVVDPCRPSENLLDQLR